MTDMEVLEQGSGGRPLARRLILVLVSVGAAVLGITALILLMRESTTDVLEVSSIDSIGAVRIEPNAEDSTWQEKVGMPAGATLPGAAVRVTVTGDPRTTTTVRSSLSSGAVHIEGRAQVDVPAGGSAELTLELAPADCSATLTPDGLDEAGYRWRQPAGVQIVEDMNGKPLRLTDAARTSLDALIAELCGPAGPPPTLTFMDARLDGSYREQVLDITARVGSSADRVLTHPLDGPSLRGIGAFERPGDPVVALMWRVSPLGEQSDGVLDAYVRVITVVGDTAYPWVLRIVPPVDLQPADSSSN